MTISSPGLFPRKNGKSLGDEVGTMTPFCVLNTKEKKTAFRLWVTAYASETNKNRRKAISTGPPRGDFFWGEGTAVRTQAIIKPCRRPLLDIESHVRAKHILIWALRIPFWDAGIQTYEKWVQALLPLFPFPPPYPREPQESLFAG